MTLVIAPAVRSTRNSSSSFDTVSFGGFIDGLKETLGRKLYAKKTEYVVEQMKSAVEDQKLAIREASAEYLEILDTRFKLAGIEVDTIPVDEAQLDAYNEGWLFGFYAGLNKAQAMEARGIWFKASKEELLVKFLTEMKDALAANYKANPTAFNDGAAEGYANWLQGLDGGWVSF